MRWLIIPGVLALSACAGQIPPPAIAARIETVRVPVTVACVDQAKVPAMPAPVGTRLTGDAVHDAGILATVDLRLRSALDEALALISGCVAAK